MTLRGEPYLLWRAVDEHGAELDGLVQKRRDKAARRFFRWVLRSTPAPRKIVTDKLHSYAAAKAEIPELANVKHVFVKAAARVNNRAENSHQPTRRHERQMCGFRGPKRTQAFLFSFGPIRQHCVLPRHRMSAARHRIGLKARFTAWQRWSMAESRINAFDWHAENTIGTIQPASTNLTVPAGVLRLLVCVARLQPMKTSPLERTCLALCRIRGLLTAAGSFCAITKCTSTSGLMSLKSMANSAS